MRKIYLTHKEIEESVSSYTLKNEISKIIWQLKEEGRECLVNDIEGSIIRILSMEIKEYENIYKLYGARMDKPVISLGDFKIYNYGRSKEYLFSKYHLQGSKNNFLAFGESDCLLSIIVKARDEIKAVELSDRLCETFDYATNLMIANLPYRHQIGTLNYRGRKTRDVLVGANGGLGLHVKKTIARDVQIDDAVFVDSSIGNDKIWKLITKKNKSQIEKRLLSTIEWIGKGVIELDNSKALVQFVFAIEGMLHKNDKEFISPSITAQISDWLAFIINDKVDGRKQIVKYFKDIYKKRSAIAHGGKIEIDINDLDIALQISKLMVKAFLLEEPFCNMKTMNELSQHMEELKFR